MVKLSITAALFLGGGAVALPQNPPANSTKPGQGAPGASLGQSSTAKGSGKGGAGGLSNLMGQLLGGQGGSGGFAGLFKTYDAGTTANDFVNSQGCKDIIGIIARGSLEPGNIGSTTGSYLCTNLRLAYPSRFACQGVSSPGYTASIGDNFKPKGTTDSAIAAGTELFKSAHSRCPNSLLIFEGYSQGAALMHNVIEGLPPVVRSQIVAGVLFGDTKYQQSGGKIPGFEDSKLKIFCHGQDDVCNSKLVVTQYHFEYLNNGDLRKALDFFTGKLDAQLKARGLPVSVPVPPEPASAPAPAPAPSAKPPPAPPKPVPTAAPVAAPVAAPPPKPAPTTAPSPIPAPPPAPVAAQPKPKGEPAAAATTSNPSSGLGGLLGGDRDGQGDSADSGDDSEASESDLGALGGLFGQFAGEDAGDEDTPAGPFPNFGGGAKDGDGDGDEASTSSLPFFGFGSDEDDEASSFPFPKFGGGNADEDSSSERRRRIAVKF